MATYLGTRRNDVYVGTDTADIINGNAGNDILTGGLGADILTGGAGNDVFVFNATATRSDSTALAMDTITDFTRGADKIDLRSLSTTGLTWGGLQARPNGVWYAVVGNDTLVYADVNGDGQADLTVKLNGPMALSNTDFLGVKLNAAPVLNSNKSPSLITQLEDSGAPVGAVGTLVSAIVGPSNIGGVAQSTGIANVSDADAGTQIGLALTGTNTSFGNWWFSTDNGQHWQAVGAVSNANALLLSADTQTRLYFEPAANANGNMGNAITFRAWDQSTGQAGSFVSTAGAGGSSAFSSNTDTASLSITAVNDVLTNVLPDALIKTALETHENTPVAIEGLSVSDPDAGNARVMVNLHVDHGTLQLNPVLGGATVVGNGSGSLTLTGTIGSINLSLSSAGALSYIPQTGFDGSDTLTMSSSDTLSRAAPTGVLRDTDTVGITVINDPVAVSVSSDVSSLKAGETATLTLVFSEDVHGLSAAAFSHSALGQISNWVPATDSSTGSSVWTAQFTPFADVNLSTITLSFTGQDTLDAKGRPVVLFPMGSESVSLDVDTSIPTVTLQWQHDGSTVYTDTGVIHGKLVFSEPMQAFSEGDLSVAGGSLVAGSLAIAPDGQSATFAVQANPEFEGQLVVGLNATLFDLIGNALPGLDAAALDVDTLRPQVTAFGPVNPNLTQVSDADTSVVFEVSFSSLIRTFSADDVNVAGGKVVAGSVIQNDAQGSTIVRFEVQVDAGSVGDLVVSLNPSNAIHDLAGNSLDAGQAFSLTLPVDTVHPVATITVGHDANPVTGEIALAGSAVVTVTFSEAIQETFDGSWLDVQGLPQGVLLSEFTQVEGRNQYTATLSTTEPIDHSGPLHIGMHGPFTDLFGNVNQSDAQSNAFSLDTVAPLLMGVSLTNPPSILLANASVEVVFTFNEVISAFQLDANDVLGGSVVGLHAQGSGDVWVGTLSADPGVDVVQVAIQPGSNTTAFDAVGNAIAMDSLANGDSISLLVDNTLPTVTSWGSLSIEQGAGGTLSQAMLGQDIDYTVTFSESMTDTSLDGLQVHLQVKGQPSIALSALTWVDEGHTQASGHFVLDASSVAGASDLENVSATLALSGASVSDMAGNGCNVNASLQFLIDTHAPVLLSNTLTVMDDGQVDVSLLFDQAINHDNVQPAFFLLEGLDSLSFNVVEDANANVLHLSYHVDESGSTPVFALLNGAVSDMAGNAWSSVTLV